MTDIGMIQIGIGGSTHMRRFRLGLTSLSSLVFIIAAPNVAAQSCGTYGAQDCNPGVVYNSSGAPSFDPLHVNVAQPLQGARSFNIRTSPNVSITRIYGQQPLANIGDRPSGLTGGCNPATTSYCRQNVGTPVSISPIQAPVFSGSVISAPVIAAPVQTISPVVTPTVRFGGGFNPAAAQPRQYGENVFTPGIAHVPTSYVDRNPHTAERLLASGVTRSHTSLSVPTTSSSIQLAAPVSHSVSGGITSPVEADGGYWEQVSGPTLIGDTLATQVVCRRQAPVVQQPVQVQTRTQVVRPIVAVPTPVPVYCGATKVSNRYGIVGQPQIAPAGAFGGQFGGPVHGQQFSAVPNYNGTSHGPWKF